MNWSSVKNLLIAILVAANAFLVFNIVRQDRTRGYIESDEVAGAVELLLERGLLVDAQTVPLEKFKAPVYESFYNDEYYTTVAETVSGSEREMLMSLPSGGFSVTARNGATVDFDTEFGFSYSGNGNSDNTAYTEITASDFRAAAESGKVLAGSRLKKLSKIAKAFLDSRVPDDYALRARITDSFEDAKTGAVYLLAVQELGGHEVYSHFAVCVFEGEELIHAHGRWYFAPFDADYHTDLIDQVNILFSDLGVMRSDASEIYLSDADAVSAMIVPSAVSAVTDVHTATDAMGDTDKIPRVTAMTSCYATYWSADKTAVYFIPAWQIEHDNGRIIVYNATNGTVYASNR